MVGTALLASPVLPWKIRPILSVLPPIPPSISDTQGEKRVTVSALGRMLGLLGESVTPSASQMLSTAGRMVRNLLRLLRILEFPHLLNSVGVYISK